MKRMMWTWGVMGLLAAVAGADDTAELPQAKRMPVWPGLEKFIADELGGFVVPTTETTDWKGFVNEGDRIRGELPGHGFSYHMKRAGTFYLGVVLVDDPDGTERLEVSVNGVPIGTAVADQSGGKAIFAFAKPLELNAGDEVRFTCKTFVGYYRIHQLLFAEKPIEPPKPRFEFIEPWVRTPGTVDLCWTTTSVAPTGSVEYAAGGKRTRSKFNEYRGRNHRITLTGLDPSEEYQAKIVTTHRGEEVTSKQFTFRAIPPSPPATKATRIDIRVPEPTDTPRTDWPATVGMPFGRGVLARTGDLRLFDPSGKPVVLQADCTCRWPDGSVKWATLSFGADSSNSGPGYRLEARPDWPEDAPPSEPAASVRRSGEGWVVQTDALSFTVGENADALFTGVEIDGRPTTLGKAAELVAELPDGTSLDGSGPLADSFSVEENGPCRAVLKWRGTLRDGAKNSGWTYRIRLKLYRGRSDIGIDIAVCNEKELPTFRALRSVAIRLPNAIGAVPRVAIEGSEPAQPADGKELTLLQDKDNHFSLRRCDHIEEGARAKGFLTVSDDGHRLGVHLHDFWQTYPNGLAATREAVEIRLLPHLPADLYSDEESKGWFKRLYAWFDEGNYLFRAGQVTRSEVTLCYGEDAEPADLAAWSSTPLLPQATPAYLCSTGVLGRKLSPRTEGLWDEYDERYAHSFDRLMQLQAQNRSYGWMHYGDWCFGGGIWGNNEYDLAWSTGAQWMRTGERRYFDRGLAMARHYSTVDTMHGRFAEEAPCVVWKHCFNHVGSERTPSDFAFSIAEKAKALANPGQFHVGSDPQGHIFEEGLWLYGAMTGDRWFTDTANHVCTWQAKHLTPSFDFEIERGGGWPLICATAAYEFSGNPFYLNAARLMAERCLQRHDSEHGGWPHTPPLNETLGTPVVGGKAFASGILTYGLLRYLDAEPKPRANVRKMLVNTARWLKNESWAPSGGFVYITNSPKHHDRGDRGYVCLLAAETIAFAYEETKDEEYRDFLKTILTGVFDGSLPSNGKLFSQETRQTLFGLERARGIGVVGKVPTPRAPPANRTPANPQSRKAQSDPAAPASR